jgi:hypothetical protein
VAFHDELKLVGFQPTQTRRDGATAWSLARNRHLTYWLHVPAGGGPALFTWEFAIGGYMADYGLQLGTNEQLNQFLFPQTDREVDQDLAAVLKAIEQTEAMFAGMNFGSPTV